MAIPAVDPSSGLLPPGRHPASWPEVYQRFVTEAPAQSFRQRTFDAGKLWLDRAAELFGAGAAWIDGGFTTHKLNVPHDIDIVYLPQDVERAEAALAGNDAWGLLTLQDVLFTHPEPGGHVPRLQPMGGMVDAFIIDPTSPAHIAGWHKIWSAVKGPDGKIIPGAVKGYVEVQNP